MKHLIYADFFRINEKNYLVAGCGKSKAMRELAQDEFGLDLITIDFSSNEVAASFFFLPPVYKVDGIIYMSDSGHALDRDSICYISTDDMVYYSFPYVSLGGISVAAWQQAVAKIDSLIFVPFMPTFNERVAMLHDFFNS